MATSGRCSVTQLSVSYSYKQGCRCQDCRANKAVYTANEGQKARDRVRAYYVAHPERRKVHSKRSSDKRWLKTRGSLLESQQGLCAICGREPTDGQMGSSKNRLHLDHCHETGRIRGLLCGNCNVGLGHFRDDVRLLERAATYLQTPPAQCVENGDVW